MNLFEKASGFANRLFSKDTGKRLFEKANDIGRGIVREASNHSKLIGELAPVALALGQPEIAGALTAVSKYAPKANEVLNSIQKKKPEIKDEKPSVNFH